MLHRRAHCRIDGCDICSVDAPVGKTGRERQSAGAGGSRCRTHAAMRAILFTDKDGGKLVLRREADTLKEIWLGGSAITAVSDCHGGGFAQFAGESDASGMQDLRRHRSRLADGVVLVIAPMQRSRVALCTIPLLIVHRSRMHLQVRAENLIRRHADSQHNPQIAIVWQGKVCAYFDADGASHLGSFVTTAAGDKIDLALFM